ncbi:LamG domain-containing protein, partial [bacterium]|nr:LamG domain-containing protein [bacterium]
MCLCALLTLPQGKADAGGLVGHWPLDDAKAAGHMSQGHAGGAMAFDGKRTLDVSAQASTLGALKDFTVSMWIQHRPGPSRMLLTWSDGTMAHRMQCEVHGGRLHFGWQNGGGWQSFATRPLAWKAGEWYHVAFINDSGYGKTIVRSNDSVAAEDGNTLAPASMRVEVTTVQIGGLNGGYAFTGAIDDVRVYDIPLSRADVRALYEGKPISGKPAARVPVAKLSALERDWLHQAERQPLVMRARQEIAWAEAMAARMGVRAPELAALKTQAAGIADEDVMNAWDLYVAVRKAKRTLMFQHPAIDFDEILFVDVPYTRGPEWHHESRYRSIMCAAHGGELVALKGLSLDGQRRTLAPTDGQAALLRPDL